MQKRHEVRIDGAETLREKRKANWELQTIYQLATYDAVMCRYDSRNTSEIRTVLLRQRCSKLHNATPYIIHRI